VGKCVGVAIIVSTKSKIDS